MEPAEQPLDDAARGEVLRLAFLLLGSESMARFAVAQVTSSGRAPRTAQETALRLTSAIVDDHGGRFAIDPEAPLAVCVLARVPADERRVLALASHPRLTPSQIDALTAAPAGSAEAALTAACARVRAGLGLAPGSTDAVIAVLRAVTEAGDIRATACEIDVEERFGGVVSVLGPIEQDASGAYRDIDDIDDDIDGDDIDDIEAGPWRVTTADSSPVGLPRPRTASSSVRRDRSERRTGVRRVTANRSVLGIDVRGAAPVVAFCLVVLSAGMLWRTATSDARPLSEDARTRHTQSVPSSPSATVTASRTKRGSASDPKPAATPTRTKARSTTRSSAEARGGVVAPTSQGAVPTAATSVPVVSSSTSARRSATCSRRCSWRS